MHRLVRATTIVSIALCSSSVWRESVVQRDNVGINGKCLVITRPFSLAADFDPISPISQSPVTGFSSASIVACDCDVDLSFTKKEYAPIEIVLTEMKGYGLRAAKAIPRSVQLLAAHVPSSD
jgi:hypothetical protein